MLAMDITSFLTFKHKNQMQAHRNEMDIDSLSSSPIAGSSTSAPLNCPTQFTANGKSPSKKKLKSRLQQITKENAKLAKLVRDKNQEIDVLKQSVDSLSEILEPVPIEESHTSSSNAKNTILELNKKNFQLRMKLDAKKSQSSKRKQQLYKLKRKLKKLTKNLQKDIDEAGKGNSALTELQTSDLQSLDDDMSSMDSKPSSSRFMNSAMSVDSMAPNVRKSGTKVEELEKKICELKAQLAVQKTKICTLKIRNKNLNEEMLNYKTTVDAMDVRSYFNGMNVDTMNEQLHEQRSVFGRPEKFSAELEEFRERCKFDNFMNEF